MAGSRLQSRALAIAHKAVVMFLMAATITASCDPCGASGTCCPPGGVCLRGSCVCLDKDGWTTDCVDSQELLANCHTEGAHDSKSAAASTPKSRAQPLLDSLAADVQNTAAATSQDLPPAANTASASTAGHGNRKLQQLASLGNLAVGAATDISNTALDVGSVASQLRNFYGVEGLGIRSRLGMLPAPGGIPLLLLGGPHALPGPDGMTLGYIGGTLEYAAEMTHPITALAAATAVKEVAASEGAGNLIGADGFSGLGLATGAAAVVAKAEQQAGREISSAVEQMKQQKQQQMQQNHQELQQHSASIHQESLAAGVGSMLKGAGLLLTKLGAAADPGQNTVAVASNEAQMQAAQAGAGASDAAATAATPESGWSGYDPAYPVNMQLAQQGVADPADLSPSNGYSSSLGGPGSQQGYYSSAASLGIVSDYQQYGLDPNALQGGEPYPG